MLVGDYIAALRFGTARHANPALIYVRSVSERLRTRTFALDTPFGTTPALSVGNLLFYDANSFFRFYLSCGPVGIDLRPESDTPSSASLSAHAQTCALGGFLRNIVKFARVIAFCKLTRAILSACGEQASILTSPLLMLVRVPSREMTRDRASKPDNWPSPPLKKTSDQRANRNGDIPTGGHTV